MEELAEIPQRGKGSMQKFNLGGIVLNAMQCSLSSLPSFCFPEGQNQNPPKP